MSAVMREHVEKAAVFTRFCSFFRWNKRKNEEQTHYFSSFLSAFLVKALPIRINTPPQSTAPMIADV